MDKNKDLKKLQDCSVQMANQMMRLTVIVCDYLPEESDRMDARKLLSDMGTTIGALKELNNTDKLIAEDEPLIDEKRDLIRSIKLLAAGVDTLGTNELYLLGKHVERFHIIRYKEYLETANIMQHPDGGTLR